MEKEQEHLRKEPRKESMKEPAGKTQIKQASLKPKKNFKFLRLILLAIVGAVIYFFFKDPLISFLKTIPWLWNFIMHVTTQIGDKTYLGLIYLSFFGGLFFLLIPVEGSFLLYLASGKPFFVVIPTVIVCYVGGLFVDYLIGFILGEWLAKMLLKEEFDKKKQQINKWGGFILFFSNIFPLPMPWISLMYGAMRFKLKPFLIICLIGQALKFNLLYLGIEFLKPHYEPLWELFKSSFGNFYDLVKSVLKI